MDLQEWELLSDDGLLVDFYDHGARNENYYSYFNRNGVIDTNYFICPSPPSTPTFIKSSIEKAKTPTQLQLETVPVPSDPSMEKVQDDDFLEKKGPPLDVDSENHIPQLFFKIVKENQFVDTKMDSPISPSKGMTLCLDPIKFQFDHKGDDMEIMKPMSPRMIRDKETMMMVNSVSPKMKSEIVINKIMDLNCEKEFNIWKWSINGVGALCSISVAAATICIFIFGKSQRNKHQLKNQKLNFQISTDDKSTKNVVEHASRLNETVAAVRGVQLSRAHITFGGYYNAI